MLRELLRICEQRNYEKPSVYQGQYNAVTRGMDTKLLPILREHGMTFTAYT